jgi:hypothetical protein
MSSVATQIMTRAAEAPAATTRQAEMPPAQPHNPAQSGAAASDPPANPPPAAQPETRAAIDNEIRALAITQGLGPEFAESLIAIGAPVDMARRAAAAALATRQQPAGFPRAQVTHVGAHDDPVQFRSLATEAVYATRVNPRHQLSEPARAYTGFTTLDFARECLRRSGAAFIGLSAPEIITRALHTTSDFPVIFADTANRVLRDAYQAAPSALKRLARQSTAKDFRAKTKVQAADLAKLEKVNEAGEFKHSSFIEGKETYRIGTYGTILALSRQAIINDDLGAFTDLAGKLGVASAEFEADFLVDLLTANAGLGPTMDDGKTLFHADHGNKAGTGAALATGTLSDARLAMRRQKGINGRPIAITPKFLVVPPELETTAEVVVAAIAAAKTDDVNPFGGKLEVVVDSRLEDTGRWYVAADPVTVDGLEYSYLQGAEGPQTESKAGFEVDGVQVKVRLDYGAAFLDHRGWYTNEGA